MPHPPVTVDHRTLVRVRKICRPWPEVSEAIKWGRPHFLAGSRLFAHVGPVHQRPAVSMKVTPLHQAELAERPEFELTPYSAHTGWISRYTDTPMDWEEVTEYLRVGYRLVALRRMLLAMDAVSH